MTQKIVWSVKQDPNKWGSNGRSLRLPFRAEYVIRLIRWIQSFRR